MLTTASVCNNGFLVEGHLHFDASEQRPSEQSAMPDLPLGMHMPACMLEHLSYRFQRNVQAELYLIKGSLKKGPSCCDALSLCVRYVVILWCQVLSSRIARHEAHQARTAQVFTRSAL